MDYSIDQKKVCDNYDKFVCGELDCKRDCGFEKQFRQKLFLNKKQYCGKECLYCNLDGMCTSDDIRQDPNGDCEVFEPNEE
jgi:hypothetical protein